MLENQHLQLFVAYFTVANYGIHKTEKKLFTEIQYRPFTTSIFRTHFERSNNNFF
jgi:hypothetical protein